MIEDWGWRIKNWDFGVDAATAVRLREALTMLPEQVQAVRPQRQELDGQAQPDVQG